MRSSLAMALCLSLGITPSGGIGIILGQDAGSCCEPGVLCLVECDTELLPPVPVGDARFGSGFCEHEDLVVVGAPREEPHLDQGRGAAYVYMRRDSGWVLATRLISPWHDTVGLQFGVPAATNGRYVFVAELLEDRSGAVHVFRVPEDGLWPPSPQPEATLRLPNPHSFDHFGNSIDCIGNRLIVGCRGTNQAYIYELVDGTWTLAATLSPSQTPAADANFGAVGVRITEEYATVGANGWNDRQGAVFVYAKPSTGWADMTETQMLVPPAGSTSTEFGHLVRIDGNLLLVGAPSVIWNTDAGAAYLYELQEGVWTLKAKLTASNGATGDGLAASGGWIHDNKIFLGAAYNDAEGLQDAGTLYVYIMPPTGWCDMIETRAFRTSDTVTGDVFGSYMLAAGNSLFVSAPHANRGAPLSGVVHVLALTELLPVMLSVGATRSSGTVAVPVRLASPCESGGGSLGLSHAPELVCPRFVELGSGMDPVPEFWIPNLAPAASADGTNGVTISWLMSSVDPRRTLPAGDREIVIFVYDVRRPGTYTARIVDGLGNPPLETTLSVIPDPGDPEPVGVTPQTSPALITLTGVRFIRGDVDRNGRININDPVSVIYYLFGGLTLGCLDAADVNDNGAVNVVDAIALLDYLFRTGSVPLPPFPACGGDPTDDSLTCDAFDVCRICE